MLDIQTTNAGRVSFFNHPNSCPFCHETITPNYITGQKNNSSKELELLMSCPNTECLKTFIAYFKQQVGQTYYRYTGCHTIGSKETKIFNEAILSISSSFVTIYNEAYASEQMDLTEICGVGYRKALEFLIKDYSISNNPSDEVKIKKMNLAKVIGDYVNDDRVKKVAKRAVWLGNDETHYVRKWEEKDLSDLKKLIELTVHWVEMEALTKEFESEMPD